MPSILQIIGGIMNHYTYEIEFENGMKYVGVRSCKCDPKEDNYLGSSKIIPPKLYSTCEKHILHTFETRIEALYDEIRMHEELDIAVNPNYYNQVKQTSKKFDQQGTAKETHKHIAAMADKLKGRSKKDYEYLKQAGKKRSSLRGTNRTEAQQAGSIKMGETIKGVKNPAKGNPSINHPRYRPWYYITPSGEYIEVYDTVRNYIAEDKAPKEFTQRAITYAMCCKCHLPLLKGCLKDYVFGWLDTKPDYLTQDNILLTIQILTHLPFASPNKVDSKNYKGRIENITGKK